MAFGRPDDVMEPGPLCLLLRAGSLSLAARHLLLRWCGLTLLKLQDGSCSTRTFQFTDHLNKTLKKQQQQQKKKILLETASSKS